MAINHQIRVIDNSHERAVDELKDFAADETLEIKRLLGRVQRDAGSIAETMKKIHGGEWTVSINHENCFVIVAQDFS